MTTPAKKKLSAGEMISQPIHEPGLIMSLGIICVHWAQLEMVMSIYYALMVFGKEVGEEANREAYLAVVDAFESLSSWESKKKLLVAATKRRLGAETSKKLDDLLKNIGKRHFRRNNVIHARWFLSDLKNTWIRKRGLVTVEEPEEFDSGKLLRIRNDVLDDIASLGAFFDELKPLLKGTGLSLYLQALFAMQSECKDTLKGVLGGT